MFKECDSNIGVTGYDFHEFVCEEYCSLLNGGLEDVNKDITFKHKLNFVKDHYKL